MHSVLITNREGKILLSRYFDTRQGSLPPLVAGVSENAAEFESGSDSGAASMIRDRAMAMRSSESEVLGQTRHLWTKGTAEYPQVARVKVRMLLWQSAITKNILYNVVLLKSIWNFPGIFQYCSSKVFSPPVCVCVLSSHLFWTSGLWTYHGTSRGHTGRKVTPDFSTFLLRCLP